MYLFFLCFLFNLSLWFSDGNNTYIIYKSAFPVQELHASYDIIIFINILTTNKIKYTTISLNVNIIFCAFGFSY